MTGEEAARLWLSGYTNKRTRAAYAYDLTVVSRALGHSDWSRLDRASIAGVLLKLKQDYAPNTVRRIHAALKSLAGELAMQEVITGPTYHGIRRQKLQLPKADPAGRYITRPEQARLFVVADQIALSEREALMIKGVLALGFGAGLRKSEILACRAEYYEDGKLRIPEAKGGKERTVYLAGEARKRLEAAFAAQVSFASFNHEHWAQLRYRAGMSDLTTHDMRRTFASDLWDAGVDASTIADILGHRSIETSRKYDRRGEDRKRRAAKALLGGR